MARAEAIQDRTMQLMQRTEEAVVALIAEIEAAVTNKIADEFITTARQLQRRAQWRLDFVAAENSMGFHAPQETARILAEAIDFAQQGRLALHARK